MLKLPRPLHPMWIRFPIEKADISWRGFPVCSALLPIRSALSLRKSWTFSFMLPYSRQLMFVDISLDCVESLRPLHGTLVRILPPFSLMFPYSRRVIIVLRRSPYGVVFDGYVFGLFVPLHPKFL